MATLGQLLQQPAILFLVGAVRSSAAAYMANLRLEQCNWCRLAGAVVLVLEAVVPPLLNKSHSE